MKCSIERHQTASVIATVGLGTAAYGLYRFGKYARESKGGGLSPSGEPLSQSSMSKSYQVRWGLIAVAGLAVGITGLMKACK